MKRMLMLLSLCAVVALGLVTLKTYAAAEVTGTWTADVQTPDGNTMTLTFHFTQDGPKLTGNVAAPQGDPFEIQNGKVDGDTITFDTSFNGTTIKHEGKVSGDEIKLSAKADNPDFPAMDLTLKRSR